MVSVEVAMCCSFDPICCSFDPKRTFGNCGIFRRSDMNDIVRIHCLAEISGQKRPRYSIVIGFVMVDVKEIIFKHFWGVILGSP